MANYQPPTTVDCVRCVARTARGGQCTRSTCKYSDLCWQHTKSQRGVQINSTNNRGMGLFASRNLKRGERFRYAREDDQVEYDETQTRDDIENAYTLCDRRICADARSTQSGLGRWVNEVRRQRPNAKLTIGHDRNDEFYSNIVLIKNIPNGQEILTHYGDAYNRDYHLT